MGAWGNEGVAEAVGALIIAKPRSQNLDVRKEDGDSFGVQVRVRVRSGSSTLWRPLLITSPPFHKRKRIKHQNNNKNNNILSSVATRRVKVINCYSNCSSSSKGGIKVLLRENNSPTTSVTLLVNRN